MRDNKGEMSNNSLEISAKNQGVLSTTLPLNFIRTILVRCCEIGNLAKLHHWPADGHLQN